MPIELYIYFLTILGRTTPNTLSMLYSSSSFRSQKHLNSPVLSSSGCRECGISCPLVFFFPQPTPISSISSNLSVYPHENIWSSIAHGVSNYKKIIQYSFTQMFLSFSVIPVAFIQFSFPHIFIYFIPPVSSGLPLFLFAHTVRFYYFLYVNITFIFSFVFLLLCLFLSALLFHFFVSAWSLHTISEGFHFFLLTIFPEFFLFLIFSLSFCLHLSYLIYLQ